MTRGLAVLCGLGLPLVLAAADWPQWMGPNRDGVWPETGILRTLPKDGPKVLWRVPVGSGYAGPAVAGGKVYLPDRILGKGAANPADPFDNHTRVPGTERLLCLDARTGRELWRHEYPCPYQISYPSGPRCTPAVHDGKVYTLGAMGHLFCLACDTGKVIWSKHFPADYGAKVPLWGYCGHPLVYQDLVVCVVGGEGALVVAFDKDSGQERWRSLTAREPGYSPPTIVRVGGEDQLIVWHAQAVNGLDPLTGKQHWSVEVAPAFGMAIMAPRPAAGDRLFVAGIGGAGGVLRLDPVAKTATPLWLETRIKGKEMLPKPRGLYPVNMTPFIDGEVIYGVDQAGMLRAVDLNTGRRLWFTYRPVIGREEAEDYKDARSATAFVVKNGDRFFLFAETGDLVLARLTPQKYEELGRWHLLEPTSTAFNRKVVWCHPAFADKCCFVRNDTELVCVSLAGE